MFHECSDLKKSKDEISKTVPNLKQPGQTDFNIPSPLRICFACKKAAILKISAISIAIDVGDFVPSALGNGILSTVTGEVG